MGEPAAPIVKHVRSRENALFKALVRLGASARERRERGATLLDGPHLIEAFREAGGIAETVVAAETASGRSEVRELLERTPARARAILPDRLFDEVAQVASPTGILAVIPTPAAPTAPVHAETCVLLDGLQDPGNLGSVLRTAVAAGVRHVFLSKGCVFAWSPKVLRAGQGAHFCLAIHERAALAELAAAFHGTVATTDVRAGVSLFEADLSGPVAWVFGAEGSGVSAPLAARATLRVRIPMPGRAESLNVAAAAAICLFEQVRQAGLRTPAARRGRPA